MAFATSPPTNFTSSWTFSTCDHLQYHTRPHPTKHSDEGPSCSTVVHTVPSARRAKAPTPLPTKASLPSSSTTQQAVGINEIVNSLAPVIESTSSTTSRRSSSLPPSLKAITTKRPAVDKKNSTTSQKRSVADKKKNVTATTTPTSQNKKISSRTKRMGRKQPVNVDIVPDVPAVPSVTEEESQFLNEQMEKRKIEKAQQALKKANKTDVASKQKTIQDEKSPRKRTRSSISNKKKNSRLISGNKINTSPSSLQDTFRAYMSEISQNDLLGQSEVTQLANQIRDGMKIEREHRSLQSKLGYKPSIVQLSTHLNMPLNEIQRLRMSGTAAKNALVAANLRLVTCIANKLYKLKNNTSMQGLTIDDMVQEGSVGLIRAAEKFDVTKGYRFSTYATWWVRAYVMRSITNQGRCIKVPSSVVDEYGRIKKKYAELRAKSMINTVSLSTSSSEMAQLDEQVAAELGITVAKLRMVVNVVTQVPASLDLPIDGSDARSNSSVSANAAAGVSSGSRSLGEIVKGDDHIEQRMVEEMERKELDMAMKKHLRPVERAVVRLRFGLDDGQARSFRETGEVLGLSKERIRQIVFRALPKLKTPEIQRMLHEATARG